MSNNPSKSIIEQTAVKWGLITFVLLSLYFLIAKALGIIHIFELRIFNAVIMFFGVYKAISTAKYRLDEFNYFKGLGTGLLTAIVASLTFAAFGAIYLFLIDPSFISSIRTNEPFGIYINKYGAVIQIFVEGTASGCLISYACMQRLKISRLNINEQINNQ